MPGAAKRGSGGPPDLVYPRGSPFFLIAPRRPNYRAPARRQPWTSTPYPSREVSSGRVIPTSLKLLLTLAITITINNAITSTTKIEQKQNSRG